MPEPGFLRAALFATGGLLVWAADFLFLYGLAALACGRGYHFSTLAGIGILNLANAGATSLAAAASAALLVKAWRCAHAGHGTADATLFIARIALLIAILALVAIGMLGIPAFVVTNPCETG